MLGVWNLVIVLEICDYILVMSWKDRGENDNGELFYGIINYNENSGVASHIACYQLEDNDEQNVEYVVFCYPLVY